MTTGVRVLCRPSLAAGFGLAGLTADVLPDTVDPASVIGPLIARADVGVVLVEESIYDGLAPDFRGRLDRLARPVIIPFPSPAGHAAASALDRVVELLRHAIGYRVRLR